MQEFSLGRKTAKRRLAIEPAREIVEILDFVSLRPGASALIGISRCRSQAEQQRKR
jgi:hypothetical protein